MKKILVAIKRVIDYNVRIRVRSDGSGVETDGVKMSINPFDEIALEEALRIRENSGCEEIVAVSIGSADCQQQLRAGLAMGADRAILVATEHAIESLAAARILLEIVKREEPELVLLGRQAIDDDNNQTGQILAALWDRPQATNASVIALSDDRATVTREVDSGLETISVELPAVITADLRLNEPRYVKLPDIMKAKRKPLETIPVSDLDLDVAPQLQILSVRPPPQRQQGIKVESVEELTAALESKGLL